MRHPNPLQCSELLVHNSGTSQNTRIFENHICTKFKLHKYRMCHNADNHNMNFHHCETLPQSLSQTFLYASKPYWNTYLQSMKLMSIKKGLNYLSHTSILLSTVPHYCSFMTIILLMQLLRLPMLSYKFHEYVETTL